MAGHKSTSNIRHETPEYGGDSVSGELKNLGKDTLKSLFGDFFSEIGKDASSQIIGIETHKTHPKKGELKEGEEISLKEKIEETEVKSERIQRHIEVIRETEIESKESERESVELRARVDEILFELKALAKANEQIEVVFKHVAQEDVPEKPGKYHLSFYEWALISIKRLRVQAETSATFLTVAASKKQQKQYWNQAKKQGTSFTLHHDRNVSTQTG